MATVEELPELDDNSDDEGDPEMTRVLYGLERAPTEELTAPLEAKGVRREESGLIPIPPLPRVDEATVDHQLAISAEDMRAAQFSQARSERMDGHRYRRFKTYNLEMVRD